MPTRNGKEYLVYYPCNCCFKYGSHKLFDYKCSYCYKNTTDEGEDNKHKIMITEWIKKNTFDGSGTRLDAFIRGACKMNDRVFQGVLDELWDETGTLLHSSYARELLREKDTHNRRHIIGAHVGDWWNILSSRHGGDWPLVVVCY